MLRRVPIRMSPAPAGIGVGSVQQQTDRFVVISNSFIVVPKTGVNGGGIMHHAARLGVPVAAARNCATHDPLSVATRGRRCTAWSFMRLFDWRLSTRV